MRLFILAIFHLIQINNNKWKYITCTLYWVRVITNLEHFSNFCFCRLSDNVPIVNVIVNKDNVLLRGCTLRNTDYVEGLVIYAGNVLCYINTLMDFWLPVWCIIVSIRKKGVQLKSHLYQYKKLFAHAWCLNMIRKHKIIKTYE